MEARLVTDGSTQPFQRWKTDSVPCRPGQKGDCVGPRGRGDTMFGGTCSARHQIAATRRAALWIGLLGWLGPLLACGFPALMETTPETEVPAAEDRAGTTIATLAAPTSLPSETASPTTTATATATVFAARFTTDVDANCRGGPGTVYDIVSWLPSGTTVEIAGKDSTGTWWYVEHDPPCWVSSITGRAEGDLSGVPLRAAPPTPTPTYTPTPTSSPTPGVIFRPPVTIVFPFRPITANAVVDSSSYSGACPHRANWTGTITVSGPMTVGYNWETADASGPFSPTLTGGWLTFSAAGSQAVNPYWLQTTSDTQVRARLHVTSPSSAYSNEASVTIDCTP